MSVSKTDFTGSQIPPSPFDLASIPSPHLTAVRSNELKPSANNSDAYLSDMDQCFDQALIEYHLRTNQGQAFGQIELTAIAGDTTDPKLKRAFHDLFKHSHDNSAEPGLRSIGDGARAKFMFGVIADTTKEPRFAAVTPRVAVFQSEPIAPPDAAERPVRRKVIIPMVEPRLPKPRPISVLKPVIKQPDAEKGKKRGVANLGDTGWQVDAACKASVNDDFYAESAQKVIAAKRICMQCPVIERCLRFVETFDASTEKFGIYGGLTFSERKVRRELLRDADPDAVQRYVDAARTDFSREFDTIGACRKMRGNRV